jgi:hypothetical protein
MSSQSDSYSVVTLSDRVVPGFAGIMRASMLARQSNFPQEIKVIVGSPSHMGKGKAINFAKKVTKHLRASRGWSFVNASVELISVQQLPTLGTPQQSKGALTAWVVE